jgi:gas vesicle protein
MRAMHAFVWGAITGGLVVWLWGEEIRDSVGERTRGVRIKAARGLRTVEEKTGDVLERSASALHRAGEFVDETKGQVREALRAGEEAIRPAPRT